MLEPLTVIARFFADRQEWSELERAYRSMLGRAHRIPKPEVRSEVTWELCRRLGLLFRDHLEDPALALDAFEDAVAEGDEARSLAYLADVRQAVGDAHGSLREIVTHFRTRIDPRGLAHALEALVARFRERNTIVLSYTNTGAPLSLSDEVQTEVFHIVQEALANIERHSQARHAWLSIEGGPLGFELRVDDDGIGARPADEQCDEGSHFGIGIMSERAQRLRGEFSVGARPGGGTRVRLAWNAAGAAS